MKYLFPSFIGFTFMLFLACSRDSTPNTNPPESVVGSWVAKNDLQQLERVVKPDGTCDGSSDDADGKYYLDAIKIAASGQYMELSTIEEDTPAGGLFIYKGQVHPDGKFIFNPDILKTIANQGGPVFKSYSHYVSAKGDALTYNIKQQEVVYEGKSHKMDNSSEDFVRVTDSELNKYIAQVKVCAKGAVTKR